jgi:hypothetical protein
MMILITISIASIISIFWVRGIDYMQKYYPDYKGEDLFNEKLEKVKENEKKENTMSI